VTAGGVAGLAAAGGAAKPSLAQLLLQLARSEAELFATPGDRVAYASFRIDDHREVWPLRSRGFRTWIARRIYQETKRVANAQALADALMTLEGDALFGGVERPVSLRVAEHEGAYYLDLADSRWRVVKIRPGSWSVIKTAPVAFRRTRGTLALPRPARGGDLAELLSFLNVTPDGFRLLLAWLLAAARPIGPFPILNLLGEQGAAKTTTAQVLRALIDPAEPMVRAAPKEDRDLAVAVLNNHVLALDNLSAIPTGLSDALCRFSTGGGWACRALYSDDDEVLIHAQRPIILTGIEELAHRPDLKDRVIAAELPEISERRRREESTFWRAFEAARPMLLGALLDVLAGGLEQLPTVELDRLPRMADFARWVSACEPALRWPTGTFMAAYAQNRAQLTESILEGHETINLIRRHRRCHRSFGSVADLLTRLRELCESDPEKAKQLPKTARGLSGLLRRYVPELRAVGVEVRFGRHGERGTPVSIIKHEREGKTPSGSSDRQYDRKSAASRPDGRADDLASMPVGIVRTADDRGHRRRLTGSRSSAREARKSAASDGPERPDGVSRHSSA
jgi:hypothetical protein